MDKSVVYPMMFALFFAGITTGSLLATYLVIDPMKEQAVTLECATYNPKGEFEWNYQKNSLEKQLNAKHLQIVIEYGQRYNIAVPNIRKYMIFA